MGRDGLEDETNGMRGGHVEATYLIQCIAVTDPLGDCSLGSSRAHVLRLALQLCFPLRVRSLQLFSQVLHPRDTLGERLKTRTNPRGTQEGQQLYGVASLQLLSQVLHPRDTLSEPDADMGIGMTPHLKPDRCEATACSCSARCYTPRSTPAVSPDCASATNWQASRG